MRTKGVFAYTALAVVLGLVAAVLVARRASHSIANSLLERAVHQRSKSILSESKGSNLGDSVMDLPLHGGEDEGDVHVPAATVQSYTFKHAKGHSTLAQKQRRVQLVVVPKIGTYKDLPPGEYRTSGKGGMFFNGTEEKCMEGVGGTLGGINAQHETGVGKRLCAEEVVDNFDSNVVPIAKVDCSAEGNVDQDCGTYSWQSWFKHRYATPRLAQKMSADSSMNKQQRLIDFFEYPGKGSDQHSVKHNMPSSNTQDGLASASRTRVPATQTKKLYQESFEQAMKAQDMYDQSSNDGTYENSKAMGHFGKNLRQPQFSPASAPTHRQASPGQSRMSYYMETGAGIKAPHPTLLKGSDRPTPSAKAAPRRGAAGRRGAAAPAGMAAAGRAQALYQESFEQAMKAEAMYEQRSNDGYMADVNAVGRFGLNLRQPQLSPAAAPSGWAAAPGEARARALIEA